MKMISLTTKMIAKNGCAILVQANVPTEVPARLEETAIANGCIPADMMKTNEPLEMIPEGEVVEVADEAGNRALAIMNAVNDLVDDGDTKNFTKSGTPKVEAIEEILGYDISADERDAAWEAITEE